MDITNAGKFDKPLSFQRIQLGLLTIVAHLITLAFTLLVSTWVSSSTCAVSTHDTVLTWPSQLTIVYINRLMQDPVSRTHRLGRIASLFNAATAAKEIEAAAKADRLNLGSSVFGRCFGDNTNAFGNQWCRYLLWSSPRSRQLLGALLQGVVTGERARKIRYARARTCCSCC